MNNMQDNDSVTLEGVRRPSHHVCIQCLVGIVCDTWAKRQPVFGIVEQLSHGGAWQFSSCLSKTMKKLQDGCRSQGRA